MNRPNPVSPETPADDPPPPLHARSGKEDQPMHNTSLNGPGTATPHPQRRASDLTNAGTPKPATDAPGRTPNQADLAQLQALNTEAWSLRMSDPQRSTVLGQEALSLAERLGNTHQVVAALRTLALYDINATDFRSALDRLNRTMTLLAARPDMGLERECKNLLAALYHNLSNNDRATSLQLECFELAKQLGHKDGQANALLNLGNICCMGLNDRQSAIGYFRRALEIQLQTDNTRGQATTLYNLAEVLVELGRWDEAIDTATEGREAAVAGGVRLLEATNMNTIARAYNGLGLHDLAEPMHDQAITLLNSLNLDHPDIQGNMQLNRAENLMALGRHGEAEQLIRTTLNFVEEHALPELRVTVHRTLADLYKQTGQYLQAMTHSETAFVLKEHLDTQQAGERTRGMLMQFEVDRAQTETELYRIRTEELAAINAQLEEAARERATLLDTLQDQQALLERQVREDALSGLYNRRHAEVLLDAAFQDATHGGDPFVICMIDIDHFKRVNDHYSHQTGDEVIRQVGQLLKTSLRERDVVGRYGGEEFVMMLAATSLEQARKVTERLRLSIQNHDWEQVAPGLKVTLSVGAAISTGHVTWERIVGAADVKLYEAKRTRNTVAC